MAQRGDHRSGEAMTTVFELAKKFVADRRAEAEAVAARELDARIARGEKVCFLDTKSTKVWRYVRYAPTRANGHRLYVGTARVVDNEAHGRLFIDFLTTEADTLFQQGKLSSKNGYVAYGQEPPNDLELNYENTDLANHLRFVFRAATKDLQVTKAPLVLARVMETLKQAQTIDTGLPPALTEKSLHGLLGDFVDIAYPATEGCKELLMFQMVPLLGALMGDSYYLPFGADKHFASLFSLVIARTADGKGQAQNACEDAIAAISAKDPTFRVHTGVASGEGLVRMLGENIAMEGTHKKRVAIITGEMASMFVSQNRKDSSLGPHIRSAFDGKLLENFRSSGKVSQVANNYLLGLVGSITPKELQIVMPQMDWNNGAQNRFLWSIGHKAHSLEVSTTRLDWSQWAARVKALLDLNLGTLPTPVEYSPEGDEVFRDWCKSIPPHDDSVLADSRALAKALCVRVAVLYAMLDERRLSGWKVQLEPSHVEAAIEIVQHSWQSVAWYLARATNEKQKVAIADIQKIRMALLKKVRSGHDAELTATEVYDIFSGNIPADKRDEICMAAELKPNKRTSNAGQPIIVWTR